MEIVILESWTDPLPRVTQSDLDIMARTIYGEARGESHRGRVAVGLVIINRWAYAMENDGGGNDVTLAAVCLRPWQFSGWRLNDHNLEAQQEADLGVPAFVQCYAAGLDALRLWQQGMDFTEGARHYHASSVAPRWAEGVDPSLEIGAHLFYRGIA